MIPISTLLLAISEQQPRRGISFEPEYTTNDSHDERVDAEQAAPEEGANEHLVARFRIGRNGHSHASVTGARTQE